MDESASILLFVCIRIVDSVESGQADAYAETIISFVISFVPAQELIIRITNNNRFGNFILHVLGGVKRHGLSC